jgi:hypothetical protein
MRPLSGCSKGAQTIRLLREFEAQWQDTTMIAFLSLPWPPQSDQALGPIIEALWCRGEG